MAGEGKRGGLPLHIGLAGAMFIFGQSFIPLPLVRVSD